MSDVDEKRELLEAALAGIYWGEFQSACYDAAMLLDIADDEERRARFLQTHPLMSQVVEGRTRPELDVLAGHWPIAQAMIRTLVAAIRPELRPDDRVPEV